MSARGEQSNKPRSPLDKWTESDRSRHGGFAVVNQERRRARWVFPGPIGITISQRFASSQIFPGPIPQPRLWSGANRPRGCILLTSHGRAKSSSDSLPPEWLALPECPRPAILAGRSTKRPARFSALEITSRPRSPRPSSNKPVSDLLAPERLRETFRGRALESPCTWSCR